MNVVASQIKDLKTKNILIEKRINELQVEVSYDVDQKQVASLALDMINKYMSNFDNLDIVSKRTLIKLLVSSVESDGENLYINFVGDSLASKSPRSDVSRSSAYHFLCTTVCSY